MDKLSLDERCAELKARMLSAHRTKRDNKPTPVQAEKGYAKQGVRGFRKARKAIQAAIPPAVEIRSPHPLVKAALAALREAGEDYGRLQFRWKGFIDVRVSRASVRRAMKVMDTLIKRIEQAGLNVNVASRDPGYYGQFHGCTFVSDGKEQVQISVIEKMLRRENPVRESRRLENRYSYEPTGRLSLVLDANLYRAQRWSDKRGHFIEEYLDSAVVSIEQSLEARHKERMEAEQRRQRETERQRVQEEVDRQNREQKKRIEQLKDWAKTWAEAEQLRAFLSAWEKSTEGEHGAIEQGSQADGFRRWVALVIEQIDPLL